MELLGADFPKFLVGAEAQVRVGKEADRDAKGVRGQIPLVAVGTDQAEGVIGAGGHVEGVVIEAVEVPIAAGVIGTEVAGEGIDGGLQAQGEVNTEQLGGMRDALVFRDQGTLHDEPQMTGAGQPPRCGAVELTRWKGTRTTGSAMDEDGTQAQADQEDGQAKMDLLEHQAEGDEREG